MAVLLGSTPRGISVLLFVYQYLNGNRSLEQIATLTTKMNQRFFIKRELEEVRTEVAAGK